MFHFDKNGTYGTACIKLDSFITYLLLIWAVLSSTEDGTDGYKNTN